MNGAKVLACGGFTASLLQMTGGAVVAGSPRLGAALLSAAGFVMLAANLVVLFMRKAK